MAWHTLLLFCLASLSLNLIPGPDVIYIVSTTLQGQWRAGCRAALARNAAAEPPGPDTDRTPISRICKL